MIDFHNHLIPGVDDGATDLAQSRAALEAFRTQGAEAVICTPHFRASVVARPAELEEFFARLDPAWEGFRAMAAAEFAGVRVERGVEVMLDTPSPDLSDPRLRLAGTRFALVEFPYMSVPPNADRVLFELRLAGWVPVIAHPERYGNLDQGLAPAAEWRRIGARLQVNCGSVTGAYGEAARTLAWGLLRGGHADYLSSDYHARGEPLSAPCRAALEEAGGGEQARLLMDENPRRLLAGQDPLPVPPLEQRRSLVSRLFGRRR